jgi:hypothetical protein
MGTQINPSKGLSVADLQEMVTLLSAVKNAVKDHHGLTVSRINARPHGQRCPVSDTPALRELRERRAQMARQGPLRPHSLRGRLR